MTILVVGVSHNTAPVSVLERLVMEPGQVSKLQDALADTDLVRESAVLSTCNRLEIYADVERFHGSVEAVGRLLCELSETDPDGVVPHLYVHYDDASVAHLFKVSAGLDSMVVGEGQILAQVRESLRTGQESGHVGPTLNSLFQQALRVGKRAHSETGIDQAAPSLVTVALEQATGHLGPIAGKRAVVAGAGAMASLAVATLDRLGAAEIVVANRTGANAERLADKYGARAVDLDALPAAIGTADLVISCTGATNLVISAQDIASRASAERPLSVIDLALPHDVEPAVADLPGVQLVALATLAEEVHDAGVVEVTAAREIVAEEVAAFRSARAAASATPTVVALRTMATSVVESELERLWSLLPELDAQVTDEVNKAVRRVADKLLHQPTVRVKELAAEDGKLNYAAALAELFALDIDTVNAVTEGTVPGEGVRGADSEAGS